MYVWKRKIDTLINIFTHTYIYLHTCTHKHSKKPPSSVEIKKNTKTVYHLSKLQ